MTANSSLGLSNGFKTGAAAGARHGRNPLVGLPMAIVTGVGGAALGALALVGTAATLGLMFAAFFSMMAATPMGIILVTALGIGTAFCTSLAYRGSAHMLGMAKGALFDDSPRAAKAQPAPATAAAAPLMQVSVPKFSGAPPANFFNLYAAPSAPAEVTAAAQPRRTNTHTGPRVN